MGSGDQTQFLLLAYQAFYWLSYLSISLKDVTVQTLILLDVFGHPCFSSDAWLPKEANSFQKPEVSLFLHSTYTLWRAFQGEITPSP